MTGVSILIVAELKRITCVAPILSHTAMKESKRWQLISLIRTPQKISSFVFFTLRSVSHSMTSNFRILSPLFLFKKMSYFWSPNNRFLPILLCVALLGLKLKGRVVGLSVRFCFVASCIFVHTGARQCKFHCCVKVD